MLFKESDYCIKVVKIKIKPMQVIYLALKRVLDIIFSFLGLVLFIIPSIFVAIAIKIESKGPVLFKQERIGKNGKIFKCIKFRTMKTNANPDISGYEYVDVEEYITKTGRFLRKTSIDELPQLINVFFGSMSLIGYRPAQKSEEKLNSIRELFGIYQIKPGITGWAQVNGRDVLAANPTLKAKYDAYYLCHFSLTMDIKIIFKTFKYILSQDDIHEGAT